MLYHWLLWQVQASVDWPGDRTFVLIEALRDSAPTGWWICIKPHDYY